MAAPVRILLIRIVGTPTTGAWCHHCHLSTVICQNLELRNTSHRLLRLITVRWCTGCGQLDQITR